MENGQTSIEQKKAPEMPENLKAFNERREKFKVNPIIPQKQEQSSAENKSATNEQKKEENSKPEEKTLNPNTQEDNLKKLDAEADNFLNYEGDDPVSKIKKSYAHARKELTKKSQHSASLEKQILQQKALLAKFDNLLKKDDSGNYIDWNIPEKKQQTEKPEEKGPEEPTEQEMYDNYPEWKRKNDAYLLYKAKKEIKEDLNKENQEKTENQKRTENEENFKKKLLENDNISVKLFPDLVNEDSERLKRVRNIFNSDPILSQTPNGKFYAAIVADWGLQYEEKNKTKQETKTEEKSEKNNFMNLPGGANKSEKSTNKKDEMPENIKAFKQRKLRFAVNSM